MQICDCGIRRDWKLGGSTGSWLAKKMGHSDSYLLPIQAAPFHKGLDPKPFLVLKEFGSGPLQYLPPSASANNQVALAAQRGCGSHGAHTSQAQFRNKFD